MRSISSSELLRIWEQGLAQSPIQHGLVLLATACPEASPEELAKLSIGVRDGVLLSLREQVFGPKLVCLTACPSCGERLEMALSIEDIRARPSDHDAELKIGMDGIEAKFRLPNSLDLLAIEDNQDVSMARQILVGRCIVDAFRNGEKMSVDQLPIKIIEAIEERMAEADPQANVHLGLTCPVCGNRWQAAFDIVSFFWNEINVWAQRAIQEVHVIASAYGWSEREILAMSSRRRQVYLDLVSQ